MTTMPMPTKFKGFLIRETSNALIIEKNNYQDVIKFMNRHNIKHLEINPNYFKYNELDFLEEFLFLEELTILKKSIKDISPIQDLVNLKGINIEHKIKGRLNFELFTKLENCYFVWGIEGSETIFNSYSLKSLRIDNFNMSNLAEFYKLNQLVDFSICSGKISSLEGIQNLTKLAKVDLTGCSNLQTIDSIELLENLESLRLDFCKRVDDLEPIASLIKLKSLSLNSIGEVPTIEFFFGLSRLEELFFTDSTNILDGNLNVLRFLNEKRNLKKVIYKKRRHYSHKPEELGYKVPDVVMNIFKKR